MVGWEPSCFSLFLSRWKGDFLLSLAKESARTLSASAIMIYWSKTKKAKELFDGLIQSFKVIMFSYLCGV